MGLIEKKQLLSQLSPPLDQGLVSQLLDEFISMERRYIQCDWEPAELDGGHFCEVLALILYNQDSGRLDVSKQLNDCLSYVEDAKGSNSHLMSRTDGQHLAKVLRTVYKFRNQRGVAHISNNYKANHMDSRFLIECVRWAFSETLRIFWNSDRQTVAKAIRELLQFDVPAVNVFEDIVRVQRTDLSPEEEILILLHFAGEAGYSRTELGKYAQCSAPSVTRSIQKLCAPDCRQVIKLTGERYRLTDLGSKRICEQMSDKLLST